MKKRHLLRFAKEAEALAEMEARGIVLCIVFEQQLAVVKLPREFDLSTLTMSEAYGTTNPRFVPESDELRQTQAMVADIWKDSETAPPPAPDPTKEMASPDFSALPARPATDRAVADPPKGNVGTRYMGGKIIVAMVVVSGDTPELEFSREEFSHAFSSAFNGIKLLENDFYEHEAYFYLLQRHVFLSIPNSQQSYELGYAYHIVDNAMPQLGYEGSFAGADAYAAYLADHYDGKWGYVAFITKYTISNSSQIQGYRPTYQDFLLMKYSGDISYDAYVFAHETCHVFGAMDEYAKAQNASCSEKSGIFNTPNGNSDLCVPSREEPCLMRAKGNDLCHFTRRQLGIASWSYPEDLNAINGSNSNARPGIAVYKDKLFMVFRGPYGDDAIYCMTFDNGANWSTRENLAETAGMRSKTAPSLAVYDDKLFITYRGVVENKDGNRDQAVYYSTYYDGKWHGHTNLGEEIGAFSSNAPALVAFAGKLYMTYRGWSITKNDTDIYLATYSNGGWDKERCNLNDEIGARSTTYPAMCVYGGKMYLFFKSAINYDIHYATFDGTNWSPVANLNDLVDARTADGPCAAVYNGKLYLIFLSDTDLPYTDYTDGRLLYTTFDGSDWADVKDLSWIMGGRSSTGPAACSFDVKQLADGIQQYIPRLFVPFRGWSRSHQEVYICHYDKAYKPKPKSTAEVA